jgi:bis(5'-adenosyl)-triphosphatase
MIKDHNFQTSFSCPFCNPTINTCVFLESDNFKVIYNIAPVLPGHSLVIPVHHFTSFTELSEVQLLEFMQMTREGIKILCNAFNTDAFDLSLQEKPEAGQTIEHLHLHIVPRLKNDLPRPGDWYPLVHKNDDNIIENEKRRRFSDREMEIIVEKLRAVAAKPEMRV